METSPSGGRDLGTVGSQVDPAVKSYRTKSKEAWSVTCFCRQDAGSGDSWLETWTRTGGLLYYSVGSRQARYRMAAGVRTGG